MSDYQEVFILIQTYLGGFKSNHMDPTRFQIGLNFANLMRQPKIQQTKMLVTCQRFGDLFLFGLVWQYSSVQKHIALVQLVNIYKGCYRSHDLL